jgi:RNA polymerase sigma factor (sigma-70 family)
MTHASLRPVLQRLRRLAAPAVGPTDRQLLERFGAYREEEAFDLLVRRHGPMVLGVCRRILRQEEDAEDAFQATFLVLARKAAALVWQESVGGWLYEVASRTALKARAQAARRRDLERQAQPMSPTESPDVLAGRELQGLLDEEVRRLPEKYRAPVVLCYLEGKSHAEAARQLGWPTGTVKGRLSRARQRLRARLARRGLTLAAVAVAPLVADELRAAAVPAALGASTVAGALPFAAGVGAGCGVVSARALVLAEAVGHGLAAGRLRLAALLVALAVVTVGAGLLAAGGKEGRPPAGPPGARERAEAPGPKSPAGPRARLQVLRERLAERAGGNARSEAAVAAGLDWLARHQAADGHWSLSRFAEAGHCDCTGQGADSALTSDAAGTAFGLLAFLGAGITHRSADQPRHAAVVERGLTYLRHKETKEGEFDGVMYTNALATMALCEAYGLTADPALREPAQRAVDYSVRAQDPQLGGWRYRPRQGSDTSVTGWEVQALVRARLAGLDLPRKTLDGATRWLDSCEAPDGSYGYVAPQPAVSTTAVGLLCRQYLGWGRRAPTLRQGLARLDALTPGPSGNLYRDYYVSQVLHNAGGPRWDRWNRSMRDGLVAAQSKGDDPNHPHEKGSWTPGGDVYGKAGGRLMITALALRTLEVYYDTDLLRAARPPRELKAADLRALWADLASEDVPRARQAMWDLIGAPGQAVPLLKEQLHPSGATVDQQRLQRAAAELDDDSFAVRQRAAAELEKAGELAEPVLRQLLEGKPTPEVRRRAEDLLAEIAGRADSPEGRREARALEALEFSDTPEAWQLLEALARGTPEARRTREAKAALGRLGRQP